MDVVWDYRVVMHEDGVFYVHEVYYDENDNIVSWSADPIYPSGEYDDELTRDILNMYKATQKEILFERDLPFCEEDRDE